VSLLGRGIFVDGIQADDGCAGKVWIYRDIERDIVEIPLPQGSLDGLTPEQFERFPTSSVWRDVIGPAIERVRVDQNSRLEEMGRGR
jgi:hypothetical protein